MTPTPTLPGGGEELRPEEERECGKPCDPDEACDECADYWQRMVAEGLWDSARHRWTDKGWKDIINHA